MSRRPTKLVIAVLPPGARTLKLSAVGNPPCNPDWLPALVNADSSRIDVWFANAGGAPCNQSILFVPPTMENYPC